MPAPDKNSPLGVAIRAALKENEIGPGNPYALSFASKGDSGPSFGVFQADLAKNAGARSTLISILQRAGVDGFRASKIIAALEKPLMANPLSGEDQALVDGALSSEAGRKMVDLLDNVTLGTVLGHVGSSIDAAAGAGRSLDPSATLLCALWCNMSGAPSTLNAWLKGDPVMLGGRRPTAPKERVVTQDDIADYLRLTEYFQKNPGNLAHLQYSVAIGLRAMAA